jgi:chromosome segregation ATPase
VTADERLEKLVERHEALTQSVELITKAQLESEKRHAWVVDTLLRLEGSILDHDAQIGKLTESVKSLAQTVDRYIKARTNGGN